MPGRDHPPHGLHAGPNLALGLDEAATSLSRPNPRWRDHRADGVPRPARTGPPRPVTTSAGVSFAGRPSPVPLDGGTADTIRRSGDARRSATKSRGADEAVRSSYTAEPGHVTGRPSHGRQRGRHAVTDGLTTDILPVRERREGGEPSRFGVASARVVHVVGQVVDRFRMANARPLPSRGPGARPQGSKAREDRAADRRPRTHRHEPHSGVQTPPWADE